MNKQKLISFIKSQKQDSFREYWAAYLHLCWLIEQMSEEELQEVLE